jgi:ubiquinone/menaquinone biosynthesis C-methylase UbiE
MGSRVDYRTPATVYERGRALDAKDLEQWRRAVNSIVSSDYGTVLDLGAGTGIFTRAWRDWGARRVIACEPSASMRKVALQHGLASNISMLAGRAEQIPLAAGTVDLMWVSTVVHHIGDLAAWAVDTRWVLKTGGWLLIRNLFADLGTTWSLAETAGSGTGPPGVSDGDLDSRAAGRSGPGTRRDGRSSRAQPQQGHRPSGGGMNSDDAER